MKDKIIMLIIGIVIGAVLAGACFWFATTINKSDVENGKGDFSDSIDRGEMMQDRKFDRSGNSIYTNSAISNNEL